MGNKEKANEEGEMVMMTKVYFHVGIQGPCTHRPVSALIFIVEGRNITNLPLQSVGTASCIHKLPMSNVVYLYRHCVLSCCQWFGNLHTFKYTPPKIWRYIRITGYKQ